MRAVRRPLAQSGVVTLSHRRDDSLATPLRNIAAVANGGRVETHEGLAPLSCNGTITDEEFAAGKTHGMNSST